jgi:hypothetical protein
MSYRLYTCDICIREGHEEVGCHTPNELIQVGENVVCQGCLECGLFPELDDLPQEQFVPAEDKLIATLEAENTLLTQRVEELGAAGRKLIADIATYQYSSVPPRGLPAIASAANELARVLAEEPA